MSIENYDVGDPEAVKRAKDIDKFKRTQEIEDWKKLLSMEEGRRVIWNLIAGTRPMQLSYSPGGTEGEFYFLEGRRSIGVQLIAKISEIDASVYVTMQQEQIDNERRGK